MDHKLRFSRGVVSWWVWIVAGTLGLLTPSQAGAEPLAYVSHAQSDLVSVVRTTDATVVAKIAVGPNPAGVALTSDGALAYVTHQNGVSAIRTADHVVVATVAIEQENGQGIALSPGEDLVYVANPGLDTVTAIRTADHAVVATVPVGGRPWGVALAPDGTLAYVTHQDGVTAIRTADHAVVATVAIEQGNCQGIAFTPKGDLAYVANADLDSVTAIRTADHAVAATVPVGSIPTGVAFTPNGAFAYVTNWGSNNVSVIRTLDQAVVATIAVGNRPWEVAVSSQGDLAYVTESGGSHLSVIRVSDHVLLEPVTVGSGPRGLAIAPLSLPRVALSFGQTVLHPGDLLQVDLRLLTPDPVPPAGAYRFEMKLWLETPMSFPLDLISLGDLAGPQHSISLPAAFDQTMPLINNPLPSSFSPGIYILGASLADTVTGQELSVDIQPFRFIGP